MSPTLAIDEALARRRRAGERVLALGSGEIGLPVLPALGERLAEAAGLNAYGPVAGDPRLRAAAAGYWTRRSLNTDPDAVVCGPGSKPLLFALMLAVGGDVVVPVPSWVSYAAQAALAGAGAIAVRTPPGEGGVPEPEALRTAVLRARGAGRDPRSVVVTLPDNPTGTIAAPATIEKLAAVAAELDLVIVSDEIYCDLVFDPADRAVSPACFAPERTVVTTGLTKNLALGGWRTGVARLPEGRIGHELRDRLLAVASQIWSTAPAPVQSAAAYAFEEPPEVTAHVAACLRLHETVVRSVGARLTAAGRRPRADPGDVLPLSGFRAVARAAGARARRARWRGPRRPAGRAARRGPAARPGVRRVSGLTAPAHRDQPALRRDRCRALGRAGRSGPDRAAVDQRGPQPHRRGSQRSADSRRPGEP
jgi:aspartate aminotransferase